MAFLDKLAKLAAKATEALESVVAGQTQQPQQPKTPRKEDMTEEEWEEYVWEEEEKLERAEQETEERERKARIDARKAELADKVAPVDCPHGDCTWYKEEFYFTCPADCDCPRKKNTKSKWGKSAFDPKYWPYMKRWDVTEADAWEMMDDLCEDFAKEFMPNYWHGTVNKIIGFGLCEDNGLLKLIPVLNSLPKVEGMYDIDNKLEFLLFKHRWSEKLRFTWQDQIEDHPFLLAPELYTRSTEDFEYAVKLYDAMASGEIPFAHFPEATQEDADRLWKALYDADGKIKPSGLGDSDEDRYGDTLSNALNNWEADFREKDRK